MSVFKPVEHLRVQHNYHDDSWQDFTGDLVGAQINLREMPGRHTAALSFYNVVMDPSQSSGTRVIKKGDRVRISAHNGSSKRRKMGAFTVKRVSVDIDLKAPHGRQNKVTVILHGSGVAGVAGTGQSSGVASPEELSNVVTSVPFSINSDANTYAWTGTAGASTSTLTTPEGVVRTNLCTNGSVERGMTGWSGNDATVTQSTDWSDDGAYSIKVVATGASTQSFATISIPLTSGHTYTVSATIRIEGVLGGSTASTPRGIRVYDATFAHVNDTVAAPNEEGETRLTMTMTAGATNTHLIRLYNGHGAAGATVYWDSLTIEEKPSDLGFFDGDSVGYAGAGITAPTDGVLLRTNYATNPSIEDNSTTGWSTSGTVPPSVAASTTRAWVGTHSLKITWGTGGSFPAASYLTTGLTVGLTYTISCYVYVPTGSPNVQLFAPGLTAGTSTSVKDAWVRLSVTYTTAATSIGVSVNAITSPTAGQTCYVDGWQTEVGTTATAYFDGATTDTDTRTYAWTGTAHQSASTETATFAEVASIDAASEQDQILLTRESNPGTIAFEDPDGTMTVYDQAAHRTAAASHTWTDDEYTDVNMEFDTEHIINVLTLFYFEKIKKANGKGTRKVEHDVVFEEPTSIAKYGRFKKKHHIHKQADFAAYATKVFTRNADPDEVPTSITILVTTAAKLLPGFEDGHYVGSKVAVTLPDGVTTYNCRVSRIQHHIGPKTWSVQIFLRGQEMVLGGWRGHTLTTEVAHTPDKMVLNDHLDDSFGEGKTVRTNVPTTNHIEMRDDGSEGIIEFWSGVAGETSGVINPGVNGGDGSHVINFRTSHAASGVNSSSAQMQLIGSSAISNPILQMGGSTGISANDVLCTTVNATSNIHSQAGGLWMDDLNGGGTTAASIGAGGRVIRTPSSRRYKDDVEPMTLDAARVVLDLEPVTFRLKTDGGDGRTYPGFIAEQAAEVGAELWVNRDGADRPDGFRYGELTSALVLLVREQAQQIADLTTRLEALGG